MIRHFRVPGPPLSSFVALLWLYDGNLIPHARERLLPEGTVELVVNLREDAIPVFDRERPERVEVLPGVILCGPHSESFLMDTASSVSVAGVHFKLGGAFPFLGVPAGDLHNVQAPLEALWGRWAGRLRERVLEADTPDARLRALEACLLERASLPLERHPAVAYALREIGRAPHAGRVADVLEGVGLSSRRFSQLFRDEVGLTPKLFFRVRRFQEVIRRVHNASRVDWPDVALSCGYFDQSHFIRDFRAFSGLTPTAYAERRGVYKNHLPLAD